MASYDILCPARQGHLDVRHRAWNGRVLPQDSRSQNVPVLQPREPMQWLLLGSSFAPVWLHFGLILLPKIFNEIASNSEGLILVFGSSLTCELAHGQVVTYLCESGAMCDRRGGKLSRLGGSAKEEVNLWQNRGKLLLFQVVVRSSLFFFRCTFGFEFASSLKPRMNTHSRSNWLRRARILDGFKMNYSH